MQIEDLIRPLSKLQCCSKCYVSLFHPSLSFPFKMRKFAEKLKQDLFVAHQPKPPTVSISSHSPPSMESTIYHYRKQRGVNLGSWFVLERWITDEPFHSAHAPAQSDLDVARGSNAKATLEKHWDSWIVEEDWAWIAQRGINTVRIPIGYYHLCGADPAVLQHTAFCDFESVFSGAWVRITRAIEMANKYGIGVLIDLHAAPGKQNNDSHAGTSEAATFFTDKRSRKHTIDVLCILLRHLQSHANSHSPPLHNLVGIELLNEPHPSSDSDLQHWYAAAIKELRSVDPSIPLYLGDCWRTDQYADFIDRMSSSAPLVLDHHLYRCFTASDNATKAPNHTRALCDPNAGTPKTFARVSEKLGRAGGGMIVGEWSGALNPRSLTGDPGEVGAYVRAQLELYEKWCAGWFFWTYKKRHRGDKGWSFRDAVEGSVFPDWVGLRLRRVVPKDEERRARVCNELKEKALGDHTRYWSQYPGKYEHWQFGEGFAKGWGEAYMFLESGSKSQGDGRVNELGFKGAWAKRTTNDHGKGYWEYEHGFNQGVDAATRDFQTSCCF
ncbi:Glucan 1,3-beta-glucosidase 3 [Hypsizygus marmoreus]|uniref:Glucan 1,3-beta-glucosidase 3 n=1 Tax=Hypsizygus marmoreus TaxID=39966 RepID=A0A369J1X5_HYPMA|nr:Glucan 1,3-beta-glucosidase 3 [Hypsizygus marmoreus]